MAQKVTRTIGLRTAVSMNNFGKGKGGPGSLEAILRMIHPDASYVPDRATRVGGMIVEARHIQNAKSHHLVHMSACTPDDKMPVVPEAGKVHAADLDLADAPEHSEFLDGELMALVKGNDVLMCKCGMPERLFVEHCVLLAEQHGIPRVLSGFVLTKRADLDKLAVVAREGVRQISMKTAASAIAVEHAQRGSVRKRLAGGVWDELRAILGLEDDVPDEAENLKVEVMLTFDRRNGTALDQRQIQSLAERVIEDDEESGFVIETMSNRKVRAADMTISKPIQLDPFGKSVRYLDVWGELVGFDTELRVVGDV